MAQAGDCCATNVVDSSGWLAWFANEAGAGSFEKPIEDTNSLLVPSICIAEVFKVVARERGEGDALQAIAVMHQGQIVPLDGDLAVSAAILGLRHKRPLADSIVYATAQSRRSCEQLNVFRVSEGSVSPLTCHLRQNSNVNESLDQTICSRERSPRQLLN